MDSSLKFMVIYSWPLFEILDPSWDIASRSFFEKKFWSSIFSTKCLFESSEQEQYVSSYIDRDIKIFSILEPKMCRKLLKNAQFSQNRRDPIFKKLFLVFLAFQLKNPSVISKINAQITNKK